MNALLQDLAFAWRNALKQPGTALLIIITLALGIGVNTAIFSMTWHVLLAPLPYADGERLVTLQQNEVSASRENFGWSTPTLADFRAQNSVFSDLIRYEQWSLTFVGRGEPYHGAAGLVTGSFFEALGVQPALGRLMTMDDDKPGAEPVLMLSQEFWREKFGGDPSVVSSTLEIQRSVYRIVGVLPRLPGYPHVNDVWIPVSSDPYGLAGVGVNQKRNAALISRVIGKLREGVSLDAANREAGTIAQRLAASYPDDYGSDYTVTVVSVRDEMARDSAATILLLMALAVLVLLIASANVANLNLARTLRRNQELAIREAVGASPGRIARQLLVESLALALVGGLLGLLLAMPAQHLLVDLAARNTPLASEIGMNGTVLAFAFVLACVAGALGSAVSLLGHRDINQALKEGGDHVTTSVGGTHRRTALLITQFALAFVVLTTAALIVLSLVRLNRQDTGFDLDQVLAVNMTINVDLSEPERLSEKMLNFSREALTAISAIPGVDAAAIRTGAPLLEQVAMTTAFPFDIEGWPAGAAPASATLNMISENYFEVMDIPLLRGRVFTATDDGESVPVAIVNESFARRFFPNGDALGGSLSLRGQGEWHSIVGVVADTRSQGLDELEGPTAYFSYWQFSTEGVNLYVKTRANADQVADTIANVVHGLDPRQSVLVKPLHEVKADWLAPLRLRAALVGLFGLLALVVTLSGVVGVVSYNISRRIREIGVHMAIGATPADIVAMFLAQGFKVYGLGLLLGLTLLLLGAPLIAPLLYATSPLSPAIYLVSALVLTLAVLVAMYLPARKASALSPVAALHFE
ncbi:MAG: ABC transporter permease [Pseudomonadales bacterium]|jgi:predicted permease|nr:ABC transporter permease [Pseudomonadales bacterium]